VGFCEERLCQEGIELVYRESTGKNSFEFWNREASKEEDLHRVVEYPAGSARSA
jgi:S-formylglutathione hydrolase FrmB